MIQVSNKNVTDSYAGTEVGGSAEYEWGTLIVTNNPVDCLFEHGARGLVQTSEFQHLLPGTYPIHSGNRDWIIGMKFRNATAGQVPAGTVSAWLYEPGRAGLSPQSLIDPLASGASVETTDGVTDVNPTDKLSIGQGLVLTNPALGTAQLRVQIPPNPGGTTLLYDYTVTGADKASIDTFLDGVYAGLFRTDLTYLEIFFTGRTDEAIFVSDVNIFFNNDTAGTSYTRDFVASSSGGSPIQGQVTAGATFTGVVAGDSAAASIPGLMRLFVPAYADTTFYKICEFTAWSVDSVAGLTHYQIGLEAALWRNTAALTRVLMTPETAGKKFKVGSRLSVWAR